MRFDCCSSKANSAFLTYHHMGTPVFHNIKSIPKSFASHPSPNSCPVNATFRGQSVFTLPFVTHTQNSSSNTAPSHSPLSTHTLHLHCLLLNPSWILQSSGFTTLPRTLARKSTCSPPDCDPFINANTLVLKDNTCTTQKNVLSSPRHNPILRNYHFPNHNFLAHVVFTYSVPFL